MRVKDGQRVRSREYLVHRVRWFSLASVGIVTIIVLSACSAPKLTGQSVSRTVALKPVSTVGVNGGTLRIRQGSPTSLVVHTDKAVDRYLVVRQKGGDLQLGVPDDSDLRSYVLPPMPADSPIEFILTTDSLEMIRLGDGEVFVDGFKTHSLLLNANLGRARIANIDVDEWRCEMVGGVADVAVSGVARLSSVTNSSGSHYDESGLRDR
jgi:hypothetical protein